MMGLEIKSTLVISEVLIDARAVSPQQIVTEKPCTLRVTSPEILLMAFAVQATALLIVTHRVILVVLMTETGAGAVIKNGCVFMWVLGSDQLHLLRA